MTFSLLLTSLAAVTATPDNSCAAYIGQTMDPVDFAAVYASLPQVAPKDPYESTAAYNARMQQASQSIVSSLITVGRPWGHWVPKYNADTGKIAFSKYSFGHVDNLGRDLRETSSGSAGFEIVSNRVSLSEYEATNAYGAKFTVTKQSMDVKAIWDDAGHEGQLPFESFFEDLLVAMEPAVAREVIERGGAAFVLSPQPPFRIETEDYNPATFSSPTDTERKIHVMLADVRCILVHDGTKKVAFAF